MKRTLFLVMLAAALAGGCAGGQARVKGRLLHNGEPMTFPPTTVAIELSPVEENGKVDVSQVYSAVVKEDGSFEVVASKGEVPPGTYAVSIQATGQFKAQLKNFAPGTSAVRRDLEPGKNDLTIDLSRPEG
jgi:hypothetical protein